MKNALPPTGRTVATLGFTYIGNRFNTIWGNGSGTKLTKEKKMPFNYENQVTTLGASTLKVNTGRPRPRGVTKNTIVYQDQYIATLKTNGNQQNMYMVTALGTNSQWTTTTAGSVANRDIVSHAQWFGLNPLQGVPASSLTNVNLDPAQDRMALTNGCVYFDMLNTSTLSLYAKFHFFVAKENTSTDPLSLYDTAIARQSIYFNNYAFPPTAGSTSAASGNLDVIWTARSTALDTYSRIIAPPYHKFKNMKSVKSIWRTLSSKTVNLAAGDNHKLTVPFVSNQFAIKDNITTQNDTYPIGTIVCIVELQGALALDTTASTGTYDLSPGTLAMSITRKINLAPMQAPTTRFRTEYYANNQVSGGSTVPVNKTIVQGAFAAATGISL